jgi:hypothetical protein
MRGVAIDFGVPGLRAGVLASPKQSLGDGDGELLGIDVALNEGVETVEAVRAKAD